MANVLKGTCLAEVDFHVRRTNPLCVIAGRSGYDSSDGKASAAITLPTRLPHRRRHGNHGNPDRPGTMATTDGPVGADRDDDRRRDRRACDSDGTGASPCVGTRRIVGYAFYVRQSGYPGRIVVRRWYSEDVQINGAWVAQITPDPVPYVIALTIGQARQLIPAGLTRVDHLVEHARDVVELWV